MYGKVSLITKEIMNVEFEVVLNPLAPFSTLLINGEYCFIQDIDVAQVLKAIVISSTIAEFKNNVSDTWTAGSIYDTIENLN